MKNKALLRLFNEIEGKFELNTKPGIQMHIDAENLRAIFPREKQQLCVKH